MSGTHGSSDTDGTEGPNEGPNIYARLVFQRLQGNVTPVDILRPATLIGSAQGCDIRLNSKDISGAHCVISHLSGKLYLCDLRSRTGIKRNGAPIHDGTLSDGDTLTFGSFTCRVETNIDQPAIVKTDAAKTESGLSSVSPTCANIAGATDAVAQWGMPGTARSEATEQPGSTQLLALERTDAEEKLAAIEATEASLQHRQRELQSQADQQARTQRQLCEKQNELEKLQAPLTRQAAILEQETAELSARQAEFERRCQLVCVAHELAEHELAARTAEVDERQRSLDAVEQQFAEQRDALADARSEFDAALNRSDADRKRLDEQREQLQVQAQDIEARTARLVANEAELDDAMSTHEKRIEELERQRRALAEDISRLQQQAPKNPDHSEPDWPALDDQFGEAPRGSSTRPSSLVQDLQPDWDTNQQIESDDLGADGQQATEGRASESDEQLLELVVDLELVSADRIDALAKEGKRESLFSQLVQSETITPYQARHLRSGSGHCLRCGDFVILDFVAGGEWSQVRKARSLSTARSVALRRLKARWRRDQQIADSFVRCNEIMSQLRSRFVMEYYGTINRDADPIAVMEYVCGFKLSDILSRFGKLPIPVALRIGNMICKALQVAHHKGFYHGRLSPEHVMVCTDGCVKVFGFAEIAASETRRTTDSHSAKHAVPEQATDQPPDIRCDLYSLGKILNHLLTGTARGDLSTECGADCPAPLLQVIGESLASDPENRPSEPRMVIEVLDPLEQAVFASLQQRTRWSRFVDDVIRASLRADR